jgi:hypothetical protein
MRKSIIALSTTALVLVGGTAYAACGDPVPALPADPPVLTTVAAPDDATVAAAGASCELHVILWEDNSFTGTDTILDGVKVADTSRAPGQDHARPVRVRSSGVRLRGPRLQRHRQVHVRRRQLGRTGDPARGPRALLD